MDDISYDVIGTCSDLINEIINDFEEERKTTFDDIVNMLPLVCEVFRSIEKGDQYNPWAVVLFNQRCSMIGCRYFIHDFGRDSYFCVADKDGNVRGMMI